MDRTRMVPKATLPIVFVLVVLAGQPAAARMEMRDGWDAFRRSDYTEALAKYQQALDDATRAGNRQKVGGAMTSMAMVYRSIGQLRKALELLEKALVIAKDLKSKELEGRVLANMGMVYGNLGDYEKSLDYDFRSLALRRATNNRGGEAADLTHIGAIYRSLGQSEKAVDYDLQSLAVARAANDQYRQGMALCNLARDHTELERYDQALQYHEQSLALRKDISDLKGQSDDLLGMGLISMRLRQHDKALDYCRQGLALARRVNFPMSQCMGLNRIGYVLFRVGQYEEARQSFAEARQLGEKVGLPEALWSSQRGLALVAVALHKDEEAVALYLGAIDTIESIRSRLSGKEARISFMQNKLGVYTELIRLFWEMHGRSPQSGYDRKAFEIFERKQGRILLEQIAMSSARSFSGLPASIADRQVELESQLESLRSIRGDESADQKPDRVAAMDEQIRRAGQDLTTLEAEIKRNYPKYYDLMHPKPATLLEVQKQVLRPDEVILAYEMMGRASILWIIGTNHFKLVRVDAGEAEIDRMVAAFRDSLQMVLETINRGESARKSEETVRSASDALQQRARVLHDLLIPQKARELISEAKVLYIVPTGSLHTLPFEILMPPPAPASKGNPRYLIENHSVLYLSSASLLKTLREAAGVKKAGSGYPLLAFANPSYPTVKASPEKTLPLRDRSGAGETAPLGTSFMDLRAGSYAKMIRGGFQELPDTEEEAKEIKSILHAPDSSNPLLLGQAASRSNLFALNTGNRLAEYRYLVFCCHGILPEEMDEVKQPALVLSHPDPVTKREGFVTMADVLSLKLNADLVTLSACNTGSGQVLRGEGVMGLTRAFMYAGTPAVSVTLWSVESNSVKTLNVGLHRNLQGGRRPAEALREAKLSMIRGDHGPLYRHPFFWAPMVIFGDGR